MKVKVRLRFVLMTPIRVRSGNPNHELNDLSCFDRHRSGEQTNDFQGRPPDNNVTARAKALSNLIHLFRASGCPSSGLLACLSVLFYLLMTLLLPAP